MRVVDLFCGAGGFSEGLRMAGWQVIAGVDVDPDACATYRLNFSDAEVLCGDLRDESTRRRVVEIAESADVLVGGPPCQAFSQVRNHDRLLDDPRNSLYREFVRVLEAVRPLAFVMENVPGLSQMRVQEQVAEDLSLDGEYNITTQVVDACDFGVPQTRKRILFIALRRSCRVDLAPLAGLSASKTLSLDRREEGGEGAYEINGSTGSGELLKRLLDPSDLSLVTSSQAVSDLAHLEAGNREDEFAVSVLPEPQSGYQQMMRGEAPAVLCNLQVPRINEDTVLRLEAIPPGGNYLDLAHGLRGRYLTGQKWGPHNGSGKLDRKHYYAYRRLHPDIWAWTLNTKADSAYHWLSPRALSVREFARLQSFPDRFVFVTDARKGDIPGRIAGGAAHSKYRQAGNAVPPLLSQAIARHLESALCQSSDAEKRKTA